MSRIAVGGIAHETHTFVPKPTSLEGFTGQTYYEGDDLVRQMSGTPSVLGGALEGLASARCQPAPLLYASAMPSGTVTMAAYDTLVSALLQRLRAEIPVDGVLLALHGAMVAESQDDCELDRNVTYAVK
jgi:microcystin degradation protein MlrC